MSKVKVLFIHHSTGGNLIQEGHLREELKRQDPTIEFWDHDYNLFPILTSFIAHHTHLRGLTDNNGIVIGKDYNIVLSNNSPKEYKEIFSRPTSDPTLKSILSFDLIIFKNCFPTTKITSTQQLEKDIEYYQQIRESIKKYPEKQFILITPPPCRREITTWENVQRAKKLINWLVSPIYTGDIRNLHVFDFFSLLADKNGMLKKEYTRAIPFDSHPNRQANETIALQLATYIVKIINSYCHYQNHN